MTNAKYVVRVLTLAVFVIADVIWLCYSYDDDWTEWWAITCLTANTIAAIIGFLGAAVWAWT